MSLIRQTKFENQGFSLLELVVITVLISIIVATAFPTIGGLFYNDPLRKSARLIVAAVHQARQQALGSNSHVALIFESGPRTVTILPEASRTSVTGEDPAELRTVELMAPVSISSIWSFSNGRSGDDTVSVWVNERGMLEPVIIRLRAEDRELSLQGSPFSADLKIVDHNLGHPAWFVDGPSPNQ